MYQHSFKLSFHLSLTSNKSCLRVIFDFQMHNCDKKILSLFFLSFIFSFVFYCLLFFCQHTFIMNRKHKRESGVSFRRTSFLFLEKFRILIYGNINSIYIPCRIFIEKWKRQFKKKVWETTKHKKIRVILPQILATN